MSYKVNANIYYAVMRKWFYDNKIRNKVRMGQFLMNELLPHKKRS